ncbi:MAG: S41 family peptidase [candidate division Zixibacteria bacterium]|nr:S41 family peptidase [candidate division Zixibacteria bacterium]
MSQAEAEAKIDKKGSDNNRTRRFWILTIFFLITVILCVLSFYILSDKELYYPYRLSFTLSLIKNFYPEAYDAGQMMALARDGVMEQLDRYSGYLEPEDFDRVNEEFTGAYAGIGITVAGHNSGLMVMSVREDGPAGQTGIKTGDIIIRVDTTEVAGMAPYRATFLLRGPVDTKLTVFIARNNMRDTLSFTLNRKKLKLIHLAYAGLTPNKYLYLRLLDFESGTAEDVRAALDSLYLNGNKSVKGIILDLRGNPGGLLGEAITVSDYFLNKGHLIVGIKGRSRWYQSEFYTSHRDLTNGLPMAIIVDRGSASASEIFAGAMKYAGRAVLVGDTTFGKGLVQEFDELYDGSALRLTTARYYFEGNIFLNDPKSPVKDSAAGISPDYYFKWMEDEPFPLWLENSLLLREYANLYQDAIISGPERLNDSLERLESFIGFIRKKNFDFESELTQTTQQAREEIKRGGYNEKTAAIISQIYRLAKQDDSAQSLHYKDYIEQRLYQIALETKFGFDTAYRKAILPYRQDILFAEEILAKRDDH